MELSHIKTSFLLLCLIVNGISAKKWDGKSYTMDNETVTSNTHRLSKRLNCIVPSGYDSDRNSDGYYSQPESDSPLVLLTFK